MVRLCLHDYDMVFDSRTVNFKFVCNRCGDTVPDMNTALRRTWRARSIRTLAWCVVLSTLILGALLAARGW